MSYIIYEVEKTNSEKNAEKNNQKRIQAYAKMLKKATEDNFKKLQEEK